MNEELKEAIKRIEESISKNENDIKILKEQIKKLKDCTEVLGTSELIRMYFDGTAFTEIQFKSFSKNNSFYGTRSISSDDQHGKVLTITFPSYTATYQREIDKTIELISQLEKAQSINHVEVVITRMETNFY